MIKKLTKGLLDSFKWIKGIHKDRFYDGCHSLRMNYKQFRVDHCPMNELLQKKKEKKRHVKPQAKEIEIYSTAHQTSWNL